VDGVSRNGDGLRSCFDDGLLPYGGGVMAFVNETIAPSMFCEQSLKRIDAAKLLLPNEGKLLIVEDIEVQRRKLAQLLGRVFGNIVTAASAKEALAILSEQSFDMVLTDISMPGMDGVKLSHAIREEDEKVGILVMTAYPLGADQGELVTLQADGFVKKPYELEQLLDTCSNVAEKVIDRHVAHQAVIDLGKSCQEKVAQIEKMATKDPVTGLGNLNAMVAAMERAERGTLMMFKVHGFKDVNDFYGYEAGDHVLKEAGQLLLSLFTQHCSRTHESMYRISGSHFALFVDQVDIAQAKAMAHSVAEHFRSKKFVLDDTLMNFELLVGIASGRCDRLLSRADTAMNLTQKHQEGIVALSEDDYQEYKKNHSMIQTKNLIKWAIDNDRVIPCYQPILSNHDGQVRKYEALMRIENAAGSLITPDQFMEAAKRSRQYGKLSRAMIGRVLGDFADSVDCVSINLDPEDLHDTSTKAFILDKLAVFSDPERVVFEVLEVSGIEDAPEALAFLKELKSIGCKIAIDDFGAGHSNFERILILDADFLKFDGSLIKDISANVNAQLIVEMLVSFSKKVGMTTIAEYVCDEYVMETVQSLGVCESQGYHIGKPVRKEEIASVPLSAFNQN
jgi:diguanylate cyclase (GGDEF)-like protein